MTAPDFQTSPNIQTPAGPTPIIPTKYRLTSLNILFDLTSNSQTVDVGKKQTVVKNKACQRGFIYDPFIRDCRQVFSSEVLTKNSSLRENFKNCSFIQLNASEGIIFPNGTLWVESHMKAYNESMYWVNASSIYLCNNFSSNYTKKEDIWTSVLSILPIITYAGYSISVVSLIFLLMTYAKFQELRTLPGKNLLNLAGALLLHHCFFFLARQTAIIQLCQVFAVLLHYFALASFAWMSVLAYDLWKTFASKGQ